jgi:hypothetical protein
MQIPPIENFREEHFAEYGNAWWADPDGADFTLMIPDGEPVPVEGDWDGRPHEASFQLAIQVLDDLDAMREHAVAFLARIVRFDALGLDGEPYVSGVHCNARTDTVVIELGWTNEAYVRFSVSFRWSVHPDGTRVVLPYRMAFWNA